MKNPPCATPNTPAQRMAAQVTFQDQLEVITAAEQEQALKEKEEQAQQATEEQYSRACVAGMHGSAFFEQVLDAEVNRLRVLPGIEEVLLALQEKFQGRVDFLAEFALERYNERAEEQRELREALEEGVLASNEQGAGAIQRFLDHKQDVRWARGGWMWGVSGDQGSGEGSGEGDEERK